MTRQTGLDDVAYESASRAIIKPTAHAADSPAGAPGHGQAGLPLAAEPDGACAATGSVAAVSASPVHGFSKTVQSEGITLLAGLGVQGDAHAGVTVKHRSRVARDPSQPNLRQVHLVHQELLDELRSAGFDVAPGAIGENVTTRGIDLLGLPTGTLLHLGSGAAVRITGLRNPCAQLDRYQSGLTAAVLDRDGQGRLVRKAGVMAVVVAGGQVRAGDPVRVELPAGPHRRLEPV